MTVEVADFSYAVSVVSESDFLDVQNNSKCSDMDHHIGLNLKKSGLNESDLGRNITDLGEHKNTLFWLRNTFSQLIYKTEFLNSKKR